MTVRKNKESFIAALCTNCSSLLISMHRHDFSACGCDNESFIDGGQNDYIRLGGKDLSKVVTGTWTPSKENKR